MKVTISNKVLSATIHTKGAELVQLQKDNVNYIWEIDTNFWNKTSPILFPIVGALKDDSYQYDGKTYQLPRHGFARDLNFEIVKQLDHQIIFELNASEITFPSYPFDFKLLIAYTLQENKLVIEYFVRNQTDTILPFSIGAHPAFAIDGNFENYQLIFSEDMEFETHLLENNLFSGKTEKLGKGNTLKLNNERFKNDALVFKNTQNISILLQKNNKNILKITPDYFSYLGIWSKPNAPFLCIEPWCGLADSQNHNGNITEKEGINVLQPNSDFLRAIRIEVY